jgi:hypothetical protein
MRRNDRENTAKAVDEVEPKVGIFYSVNGRLFVEGSSLSEAEDYGEAKTHARSHTDFWTDLVARGQVPLDEYELNPRGRVSYRCDTDRFLLLADRCILRDNAAVAEVMRRLHLPADRTDTSTDFHYRCPKCHPSVWKE